MTHVNAFKTELKEAFDDARSALSNAETKAAKLVARIEEDFDGTDAPTTPVEANATEVASSTPTTTDATPTDDSSSDSTKDETKTK